MRSFILLALLPGCALLTEPPPVKSGEDLDTAVPSEDTATETDIGDTAEDTGTDDTATLVENPVIEVRFADVWSSEGPQVVEPGDEANLGAVVLDNVDSVEALIDQIELEMYVSNDPRNALHAYQVGSQGEVSATDYLSGCTLELVVEGWVYMGPLDITEDGELLFIDEFALMVEDTNADGKTDTTALNVFCDVYETVPSYEAGFAVDIVGVDAYLDEGQHPAETGTPVETIVTVDNGGVYPDVRAILLVETDADGG